MICLPAEYYEKIKQAIKDGRISVENFRKTSSREMRNLLEMIVGKENAELVNTFLEQKMLLKNQEKGIYDGIRELTGLSTKEKAELAAKAKERIAERNRKLYDPKENEPVLNELISDIYSKKYKTEVSLEEAQRITDLTAGADELLTKYQKQPDYGKSFEELSPESLKVGMEYGATKRIIEKYVDNLKFGELSVKGMLKEYSQEIKTLWQENKFEATQKIMGDAISGLMKTMINAVSTWDNSWVGRQGGITLVKSPKTWWNMAKKSMSDFYKTLKGSKPEDVLAAEIYADPDYINGNYKKAKLDFGIEEEVPTQILERLPVLGRVFKASDISFLDSAIRARMGLFKIQKKIYEKTGMPLTDVILEDMGTVINAITARGKLGRIGGSPLVTLFLWAPKMLKADWDVLTAHTFGFGLKTNFARKQAAKTIFNVVVATAGITAIAKSMGAEVETDPRSTDFLKIKVGNTRINTPFARGMPQIVTLFARLLTQKTKSSTGIITSLNSGEYGSKTLFDIGIDFLVNKTTPPVGAVISWLRNRTFEGKEPTVGKTALGFLPISVQNFFQLKDDASTQAVIGAFVDLFGISSNTYQQTTDWGQNPGVELQQFKALVGEQKFKEANDKFNQQFTAWLISIKTNPEFLKLTEEQKQSVITSKKSDIKDAIFKQYNFKYKKPKSTPLPKF
jgi:hypothetical protein